MLLLKRLSRLRVSGKPVNSSTMASTAATVTAQNTARQPLHSIKKLPNSGARMGDTLNTSVSNAVRLAASSPVCRSRTTARGTTMPAQAPRPCTVRHSTRV
jgi:hypothetical protein